MNTKSKRSAPTKSPRVMKKTPTKNESQEEQPIAKKPDTEKPGEKSVENEEASTSSLSSESSESKDIKVSVLQLKITLQYITPKIWRRIQVLNTATFNDLHNYIQEAMGWRRCHCHQFRVDDDSEASIVPTYMRLSDSDLIDSDVKLNEFLSNVDDSILYEYDMGDGWMHEIVVEKVLSPPPANAIYPKCLGGKRACPPEDCGGFGGYQHLLKVLKNRSHREYKELVTDWLFNFYPGFDPEKFDHKMVFNGGGIFL